MSQSFPAISLPKPAAGKTNSLLRVCKNAPTLWESEILPRPEPIFPCYPGMAGKGESKTQ
jgi:hypothetical protein